MRAELAVRELEREHAELLPAREALGLVNLNIAPVIGVNLGFALNAASPGAVAIANVQQYLAAVQHIG